MPRLLVKTSFQTCISPKGGPWLKAAPLSIKQIRYILYIPDLNSIGSGKRYDDSTPLVCKTLLRDWPGCLGGMLANGAFNKSASQTLHAI